MGLDLATSPISCMADVSIMRAIQDYSGLFWSRARFRLRTEYCILKVGPLGPAGGAAEGPELGYGAPGATYSFTNGPSPLGNVVLPKVTH